MHGSPSCAIAVGRFGAWRAAVGAVAAAALLSLAAWLVTSPHGESTWVRVAVAAAGLVTLTLAASLWRVVPVQLLWDGLGWSVAPTSGAEEAAAPGTLDVAVDLGSFLLLRFVPAGRSGPAAVRWIPVGRAGLEREWHAFRCAVYSPRAAAADPRQT
jgi:hypothetical protein